MVLTVEGWLNGASATGCLIIAFIYGFFLYYKAKKTKNKLLTYMGINIFIVGFFWLMAVIDFMTILITNNNSSNFNGFMGSFSFMWAPITTIISIFIASELMMLEKKWYILAIYSILGLINEIFLFINPLNSFEFIYPTVSGENLIMITIDINISLILYLFNSFFLFSGIIVCGFGYLIKGYRLSGRIKTKFILLSIGYILFLLLPFLYGLISHFLLPILKSYIFIVRIGMISSFLFFYRGLI